MSDLPTTIVYSPPIREGFVEWLTYDHVNNVELFLLIGIGTLLRILWNLHRRGIDFADLIVGVDGKLSWSKLLACTCGITATWGFVVMVLDHTMTEWYFNGYIGLCLGSAVWMKYLAGRQGPPPVP